MVEQREEIEGEARMPEATIENESLSIRIFGVPKLLWGGFGTYTDDLMVSSTLRLCLDFMGEKTKNIDISLPFFFS